MIVRQFHIDAPHETLDVALGLERGTANVKIVGTVRTTCEEHNKSYQHTVDIEVECGSDLPDPDLTELEWAIRGRPEAATILVERIVTRVLESRGHPCR